MSFYYIFLFLHNICNFVYFSFWFYLNCYLLMYLVFMEFAENNKKESPPQVQLIVLFSYFGMNVVMFYVNIFISSMRALNFMLWVCVLCFNIWDDYMTHFIISWSPERDFAEILARSSISSESRIKVNFKAAASR